MSTDNELKEILSKKFESFEAPVDQNLWNEVEPGINIVLSKKRVPWKKRGIILLLLLVIAVPGWLMISATGEEPESLPVQSAEGSKHAGSSPDNQAESGLALVERASAMEETTNPAESEVPRKEIQQVSSTGPFQTSVVPIQKPQVAQAISNSESPKTETSSFLPNIAMIELPDYEGMEWLNLSAPGLMEIPLSDSITTSDQKVRFKPLFGLGLNYLHLQPNTSDQTYFTDIGTSTDLSPRQWGLSLGFEMTVPLKNRVRLRNEFNLSLKQHHVSFRYQENAFDSDDSSFQEYKNTFRPLTMSLSAGLLYDLDGLGLPNMSLDLGFYYEPVIDDGLRGNDLFEYPGGLFNLNMGVTFQPKKYNWAFRVYGYYSLNKRSSDSPLAITPFGMGIQFLRNKSGN